MYKRQCRKRNKNIINTIYRIHRWIVHVNLRIGLLRKHDLIIGNADFSISKRYVINALNVYALLLDN